MLGHEIEELVVEAKRLGIGREEMLTSISTHWQRLSSGDARAQASPGMEAAKSDERHDPDREYLQEVSFYVRPQRCQPRGAGGRHLRFGWGQRRRQNNAH